MLTDNPVLVNNVKELPAIMCAQRKAEKCIPTEQDFIGANIASFGNDIGAITNRVTSMYEVRSYFEKSSDEYKMLSYRIRCGQLFQQNAIDRSKGIICKPMPEEWYDYHAVSKIEDVEKRKLYRSILADKKPYFMRYIYPALMKQYNAFNKNVNRNSLREFGIALDKLLAISYGEQSEKQRQFIDRFYHLLPVGTGGCVINRICQKIESAFDGYVKRYNTSANFDYSVMRSDAVYNSKQYASIKALYRDYTQKLAGYRALAEYERVDDYDFNMWMKMMQQDFLRDCTKVCSNGKELCNIVLDMCYSNSLTKKFAWAVCSSEIIQNLLDKNGFRISFPTLCNDGEGDIAYCGRNYRIESVDVLAEEEYI